ncbi:hypothetical protein KQX54_019775 [Cotesia glomerata]|uniref:Uncharacterized protein n=1 Tax=Cotesia glomerata TaxID=32391 RepID=A0AAV7IYE6_COTGL|nr:hypothetical protein KQX54_019775 [Cotesia glomerata]
MSYGPAHKSMKSLVPGVPGTVLSPSRTCSPFGCSAFGIHEANPKLRDTTKAPARPIDCLGFAEGKKRVRLFTSSADRAEKVRLPETPGSEDRILAQFLRSMRCCKLSVTSTEIPFKYTRVDWQELWEKEFQDKRLRVSHDIYMCVSHKSWTRRNSRESATSRNSNVLRCRNFIKKAPWQRTQSQSGSDPTPCSDRASVIKKIYSNLGRAGPSSRSEKYMPRNGKRQKAFFHMLIHEPATFMNTYGQSNLEVLPLCLLMTLKELKRNKTSFIQDVATRDYERRNFTSREGHRAPPFPVSSRVDSKSSSERHARVQHNPRDYVMLKYLSDRIRET